jgi:L-ribulokinase
MTPRSFTIGIDFGTNSVRAVVVDTADGRVAATRVFDYPSGDQGVLLDPKQPHLARQNPADYVEGLRVRNCWRRSAAPIRPSGGGPRFGAA